MEEFTTTDEMRKDLEERRAQLEIDLARDLRNELDEAKRKIEMQEETIRHLKNIIENKNGMIDGLKFAIRCNGVSGSDV